MPEACKGVFKYDSSKQLLQGRINMKGIIIGGGVGPMAGVELHKKNN